MLQKMTLISCMVLALAACDKADKPQKAVEPSKPVETKKEKPVEPHAAVQKANEQPQQPEPQKIISPEKTAEKTPEPSNHSDPKIAIGCDDQPIAQENTSPAKDSLSWTGTYSERHCREEGKPCIQIRNLTLNADGTAIRELIMNGTSMYKSPVKFTWEDNGNVISVEDAGRFYVAQNQLLWLKDGNMIYPNASTLAMCKS